MANELKPRKGFAVLLDDDGRAYVELVETIIYKDRNGTTREMVPRTVNGDKRWKFSFTKRAAIAAAARKNGEDASAAIAAAAGNDGEDAPEAATTS